MALVVDSTSRFQLTPAVIVDGPNGEKVETFGIWVRPKFLQTRPSKENIGKYAVDAGHAGRPDKIAAQIYGVSLYDWIIIAFNNAYETAGWPKAGTTIEYPLPQVVFIEIN